MSKIDTRKLRDAFGTFMTGVTVVTAWGPDGAPLGFTANSFTSVSLDPPLVLVCLANNSRNYEALTKARGFAVNVLAETQIEISNLFASRAADRFSGVGWAPGPHGAPLLDGACGWFDCSMHQVVEAGDHVILIGHVEAFGNTEAPGLGYARGAYVTPSTARHAMQRGAGVLAVSALIDRAGHVLLTADDAGGLTLPMRLAEDEGASSAVKALIGKLGIEAQPGFVYSVFEDTKGRRQHISFLCQAGDGTPGTGAFLPLDADTLSRVADPAIRTMLERYANEAALGHYGIYYGDQTSGQVRPVARQEA